MSVPRPEDLVVKPIKPQKSSKDLGEINEKKISPKFIIIGAVLGIVMLCFMVSSGNKTPVASKKAPILKVNEANVPVQTSGTAGGQQAQPPSAETIAQIDKSVLQADAAINSLILQVKSVDAEIHNMTNAAERLEQVGDQEGHRDAECQIFGLTRKRKEFEDQYNKWATYKGSLVATKTELTSVGKETK